ncbi:hypothetical protein CMMCAS05_14620 [Clavibacter michiganensis subsp. michiganensis]|nr:hypothetical protein CMMCAS05_14620 [Clavibacter michiganensis subsp. michiganensis]
MPVAADPRVVVGERVEEPGRAAVGAHRQVDQAARPVVEDRRDRVHRPAGQVVEPEAGQHAVRVGRGERDPGQPVVQGGPRRAVLEAAAVEAAAHADPGRVVPAEDGGVEEDPGLSACRLPQGVVVHPRCAGGPGGGVRGLPSSRVVAGVVVSVGRRGRRQHGLVDQPEGLGEVVEGEPREPVEHVLARAPREALRPGLLVVGDEGACVHARGEQGHVEPPEGALLRLDQRGIRGMLLDARPQVAEEVVPVDAAAERAGSAHLREEQGVGAGGAHDVPRRDVGRGRQDRADLRPALDDGAEGALVPVREGGATGADARERRSRRLVARPADRHLARLDAHAVRGRVHHLVDGRGGPRAVEAPGADADVDARALPGGELDREDAAAQHRRVEHPRRPAQGRPVLAVDLAAVLDQRLQVDGHGTVRGGDDVLEVEVGRAEHVRDGEQRAEPAEVPGQGDRGGGVLGMGHELDPAVPIARQHRGRAQADLAGEGGRERVDEVAVQREHPAVARLVDEPAAVGEAQRRDGLPAVVGVARAQVHGLQGIEPLGREAHPDEVAVVGVQAVEDARDVRAPAADRRDEVAREDGVAGEELGAVRGVGEPRIQPRVPTRCRIPGELREEGPEGEGREALREAVEEIRGRGAREPRATVQVRPLRADHRAEQGGEGEPGHAGVLDDEVALRRRVGLRGDRRMHEPGVDPGEPVRARGPRGPRVARQERHEVVAVQQLPGEVGGVRPVVDEGVVAPGTRQLGDRSGIGPRRRAPFAQPGRLQQRELGRGDRHVGSPSPLRRAGPDAERTDRAPSAARPSRASVSDTRR